MPWKETKVFTKVPQLILDKAVRNVSKELSEAWLDKRKGAARNQRWSERPRSLDLIFCRLDFPLHPNRPPPMPCHSCLAIVEQQQQLLLYSRLAKSLIFARVRQVSRLSRPTCIRQCQAAKTRFTKYMPDEPSDEMPNNSSQRVANSIDSMKRFTSHRIWKKMSIRMLDWAFESS
jgi:hypothetical protein